MGFCISTGVGVGFGDGDGDGDSDMEIVRVGTCTSETVVCAGECGKIL